MRTIGTILETITGLFIGLGVGIIVLAWSGGVPAVSVGATDLRSLFMVYSPTIAVLFLILAMICGLIYAMIFDVRI